MLFDIRMADEKLQEMIAIDYNLENLLLGMSNRLRKRHNFKNYFNRLWDGIHQIQLEHHKYLETTQLKQQELQMVLENITEFKTNLKPSKKELNKMAFFKLKKKHQYLIQKQQVNELSSEVSQEIAGDISLKFLLQKQVITNLAFAVRGKTISQLFLHYSHTSDLGWKFEVIFKNSSSQNLIGHFTISDKNYLELKRTANSEAEFVVPNLCTFKLASLVIFLNAHVRKQVL